jgi:hypothetical protein
LDCNGCPFTKDCLKGKGNRVISVNLNLDRHIDVARINLHSDQGIELRKRRGPEIETFFGDLKHNQKYKRIRLRGLTKAELEMGWLSISYNLRKATILLNKKTA